jgi:hypothetical protein
MVPSAGLGVTVRHGCPRVSSWLLTLPPPTKRLAAPHGPPTTSLCRLFSCRRRPFAGAEAPAAATACHRRKPPPSTFLPRPWAKIEPRWALVLPHLFTGQGRRRSRPIPASRAALHPRYYIASLSFFPGCYSWSRGLSVMETKVPQACR